MFEEGINKIKNIFSNNKEEKSNRNDSTREKISDEAKKIVEDRINKLQKDAEDTRADIAYLKITDEQLKNKNK